MHPAAVLQFHRMIDEYASWRAVPEGERSPAPAWWWGPAMQSRTAAEHLPAAWCDELRLPRQATYGAAAHIVLGSFAGQTSVPWPYEFPRKAGNPDPAARELHPQPLDDSAFQP